MQGSMGGMQGGMNQTMQAQTNKIPMISDARPTLQS